MNGKTHLTLFLFCISFQHANAQETFRDCATCPQMVIVPPGKFLMGSNHVPSESPANEIHIRERFAVGKFEVTFDEWEACVDSGGCARKKTRNDHGWGKGSRPVIYVTWNDAISYVEWLNSKTNGNNYRLLSEAEWEYTARAGVSGQQKYSWGERIDCSHANYAKRRGSICATEINGQQGTQPVGTYPANPFGVHDLHGNVWEWVQDCWHPTYSGQPNDTRQTGAAWTEVEDCTFRVIRGGSWLNEPDRLRSSNRSRLGATNRDFNFGFRVAKTLK